MSRITPIETRYAGCRFRSRLEARWAVFFDNLDIPWQYEPEGFNLGDEGPYLPDFLLYPNTDTAVWFEVKGTFPTDAEVRKAQALSAGTAIPAAVYYAPLKVPAPADLEQMSHDEFIDPQDTWTWDDKIGWLQVPSGPSPWEVGLAPTAFMLHPRTTTVKSSHWWWTDCDYCGKVILKLHGQVGWCPRFGDHIPADRELYPCFAHATPRLQTAYTAARSARFEFGAKSR